MRTASPWWASLVFGLGLVFVFVGERIFGYLGSGRMVLTGLGVVLVLGTTGLRAWTTLATSGARRRVERTLLMCHGAALLALILYALTTKWGLTQFHVTEKGEAKFTTTLTVIYGVLLVVSMIPMFMIEMSLGTALRTGIDVKGGGDEAIEYLRVRDIGWSGLSIAFALGLLMVTCNVATERNIQRDVSYFKTSAPGDSTKGIASSSAEPIKVLLFFPEANEVADQVANYFEALRDASGKIQIEKHDRFLDAELAGKYKVTKDGMIVLVRGTGDKEKNATIDVDTDIDRARKATKLRNFDREVNTQLIKLVREKRKAYLMVGHGEINDFESVPPDLKNTRVPERRTTLVKKRLGDLGYEVKDLGLIDLAKDVPGDATIVLMLAPSIPLQPAEWAALERYLDKGGRMLIALDPRGDGSLGALEGRLGYKLAKGDVTDDVAYLPQRMNLSDRRFAITTQFSAHASTTALSRSVDKGLVLIDAGALEDAPFTNKGEAPKKTVTIRSMDSSWLDLDENFQFDATAGEKKQRWTIGAAIEGPKMKDEAGKDKDGWRVLLFSDADLFEDAFVQSMGRIAAVLVSGPLLDDSVHWLGGEETFVGDVVSEDDKPIQHTKGQDAKWFLLTIVGAPLVVLGLGLVGTWARRRRTKKHVEVKP